MVSVIIVIEKLLSALLQRARTSVIRLLSDYLVCVMSIRHPLAKRAMVTLSELKQERMILRLPTSDTRMLFESTLKSIGDSIDNFNITLEVDNIATIKDLVRKGLGVSILPQSACAREQKKGKMAVLPIENFLPFHGIPG